MNLDVGRDGCKVGARDVEITLSAFDIRFKGHTRKAKALRNFVSPETLTIGVRGSLSVNAQYVKDKSHPDYELWEADECKFDLHIIKRISGAVTLPTGIVQVIIDLILPYFVKGLVQAIPRELGQYLSGEISSGEFSPGVKQSSNRRCVEASLQLEMAHTVSREAWISPLRTSSDARNILRSFPASDPTELGAGLPDFTDEKVNLLLAVVAAGNAVVTTGLKAKTLSLQALYAYALRYQAARTAWKGVLQTWDKRLADICCSDQRWKDGTALRFFDQVLRIGSDSLKIAVSLSALHIRLDVKRAVTTWKSFFLRNARRRFQAAQDETSKGKADEEVAKVMGSPEETLAEKIDTCRLVEHFVLEVGSRAIKAFNAEVNLDVQAGLTTRASAKCENLLLSLNLPHLLNFKIARGWSYGPEVTVVSGVDASSGGYKLDIGVWKRLKVRPSILSKVAEPSANPGARDPLRDAPATAVEPKKKRSTSALAGIQSRPAGDGSGWSLKGGEFGLGDPESLDLSKFERAALVQLNLASFQLNLASKSTELRSPLVDIDFEAQALLLPEMMEPPTGEVDKPGVLRRRTDGLFDFVPNRTDQMVEGEPAVRPAASATTASGAEEPSSLSIKLPTSVDELEDAIKECLIPLLLDESNQLRVNFGGILTAASPEEDSLFVTWTSTHAAPVNAPPNLSLKMDLRRMVRAVIKISEIEGRLRGQGIFSSTSTSAS
jgi:hypothetical protein